jgi:soluble lytic murein transglycosylase-like protein
MLRISPKGLVAGLLLLAAVPGRAAEHIVLRNGFDLICDHQQAEGSRVRLFLDAGSSNFIEVEANEIASAEPVPASPQPAATKPAAAHGPAASAPQDWRQALNAAGKAHDLDVDLLASVIHEESDGNAHAVSRTGAQGLMQLMPTTAAQLGVANSFAPDQNVRGGTAYLDWLLQRYHNKLAWALAAYNAGPAAVDKWHGIPPYRETQIYVARVIHDYNQRYAARQRAQLAARAGAASPHRAPAPYGGAGRTGRGA